jgi:hypothetical protein
MPCLARTPPTTSRAVVSPSASHRPQGSIPQAKPAQGLPCVPPRPCQTYVDRAARAARAGTPFPRATTSPAPAPHTDPHGIARPSLCHLCPDPRCTTTTQPHPVFPAAPLKPSRFHEKPPSTDTHFVFPRTGSQRRPYTPPTVANRPRRGAPWAELTSADKSWSPISGTLSPSHLPPHHSLSLPQPLRLEADASPRLKLVGAAVDRRQLGRSPSTEPPLPLCFSLKPGTPLHRLDLTLFSLSCEKKVEPTLPSP